MLGAGKMEIPRPGDVIRYRYLWAKEAADGYDAKIPRPCLVLTAAAVGDRYEVLVVPFTHEPQHDSKFMTVPEQVRRQAGLDDADSYIVYGEANVFQWPSWDVIPVKAREHDQVIRGRMSHGFQSGVKNAFDDLRTINKAAVVDREKLKAKDLDDYRRRRNERAFSR